MHACIMLEFGGPHEGGGEGDNNVLENKEKTTYRPCN